MTLQSDLLHTDTHAAYVRQHPYRAFAPDALSLLPWSLLAPERISAGIKRWLVNEGITGDEPVRLEAKHFTGYWGSHDGFIDVELASLSDYLRRLGLGVEPDPRFGGRVWDFEDEVAVFRLARPEATLLSAQYMTSKSMLTTLDPLFETDRQSDAQDRVLDALAGALPDADERSRLQAWWCTRDVNVTAELAVGAVMEFIPVPVRDEIAGMLITSFGNNALPETDALLRGALRLLEHPEAPRSSDTEVRRRERDAKALKDIATRLAPADPPPRLALPASAELGPRERRVLARLDARTDMTTFERLCHAEGLLARATALALNAHAVNVCGAQLIVITPFTIATDVLKEIQ